MADNFLSEQDVAKFSESISTMIRKSSTLLQLNLSKMNITPHGLLILLTKGLKEDNSLQSIHLSDNLFDEETEQRFMFFAEEAATEGKRAVDKIIEES